MGTQPVLTPKQMAAVDMASGPVEHLIERAGWEVAFAASQLMGGCYGRRVVVIAGGGNNGADGVVAARHLRRRGARVELFEPSVRALPTADLVIDAAFGTGLRGGWEPPRTTDPVLAVDLPSGLDPVTGEDRGALTAVATVTFGALKPGLLFGAGPERAGRVTVAPIGLRLDAATTDTWLWTSSDCLGHLPDRASTGHKWTNAVRVLGGSIGMEGAPGLVASAAMRAGSGMVVVSRPDGGRVGNLDRSVVERPLGHDWVADTLIDIDRFKAVVIGPGMGTDQSLGAAARDFISRCPIPIVIDADAIGFVAEDRSCVVERVAPTVITPHDREFERLMGSGPGTDRIAAARALADVCTVGLLKGPATTVAGINGEVAIINSGDQRLATAGTGDVLAGVISAMDLSRDILAKVATAAHWHGVAASIGAKTGIVADDVADQLATARDLLHQQPSS